MGIYGSARYVLAMRLHAAILSLIAGTPAIAMPYHGKKTQGVYRAVNRERWLLMDDDFRVESAIAIIHGIERIYDIECSELRRTISEIHMVAVNMPLKFNSLFAEAQ